LLIVYVDDLLLICPKSETATIWSQIESGIKFKDPAAPLARYLGVQHTLTRKGKVTKLSVEMKEFLQSAVDKYFTEVGVVSLPRVATPYLEVDTAVSEAEALPGLQKGTCASHLMKLLYAARMCCPWLVTIICRLASHLTRWSVYHDRALRRLFAFVARNTHLSLEFELSSDDCVDCELGLWCDADQAGNHAHTRSTSGLWIAIVSKDGKRTWPLAWNSKKQLSTASATQEAETLSLSYGLRREAIPILTLLELVLRRPVQLVAHEDNTATIVAIRVGYSPALRHLDRTARCSLGFTHEVFFPDKVESDADDEGECDPKLGFALQPKLIHCPTAEMRADVFTKVFDGPKFAAAIRLISCVGDIA
jgi:hypothetical protein